MRQVHLRRRLLLVVLPGWGPRLWPRRWPRLVPSGSSLMQWLRASQRSQGSTVGRLHGHLLLGVGVAPAQLGGHCLHQKGHQGEDCGARTSRRPRTVPLKCLHSIVRGVSADLNRNGYTTAQSMLAEDGSTYAAHAAVSTPSPHRSDFIHPT